jgi:hypothetical protein
MIQEVKLAPKLNEGQVAREIVNDSLGTADPADTTGTDPEKDPESTGTGPKGNEVLAG